MDVWGCDGNGVSLLIPLSSPSLTVGSQFRFCVFSVTNNNLGYKTSRVGGNKYLFTNQEGQHRRSSNWTTEEQNIFELPGSREESETRLRNEIPSYRTDSPWSRSPVLLPGMSSVPSRPDCLGAPLHVFCYRSLSPLGAKI